MTGKADITINRELCKRCGGEGQVNDTGLCMACVADEIRFQLFGHRSIEVIEWQIHNLLETYQEKIDTTIKKGGGGDLSVSLTVVITRFGKSLNIQTAIGFVSEKIKDKVESSTVTEDQGELFEGKAA